MTVVPTPSSAHPHVFVDGGIDFVMGDDDTLQSLELTWLYDEFETLFTISHFGLDLNEQGELDEEDRLKLVEGLSDWPEDFDGAAHLSVKKQAIQLDWPRDLDAHLVDGRLKITFVRDLSDPLNMTSTKLDVAFYESTYFFAFKLTNTPRILGPSQACRTRVTPFKADPNDAFLLSTLASLSREETPTNQNIGALFADRITLRCD